MKVSSPKEKLHAITVRIAMRGDHTTVSARGSDDPAEVVSALHRAAALLEQAQTTDVDSGQGELLDKAA